MYPSRLPSGSGGGDVPTSRQVIAGYGLIGGGDLSADRTFAVDTTLIATIADINGFVKQNGTTPLTANWNVGGFSLSGLNTLTGNTDLTLASTAGRIYLDTNSVDRLHVDHGGGLNVGGISTANELSIPGILLNNNVFLYGQTTTFGDVALAYVDTSNRVRYGGGAGGPDAWIDVAGTSHIKLRQSGTDVFVLDQSGAVLIGASPAPALGSQTANGAMIFQNAGTLAFWDSTNANIRAMLTVNNSNVGTFGNTAFNITYTGSIVTINAGTSQHILFEINSVESGRVGAGLMVGTAVDPGTGNITASGSYGLVVSGTSYPMLEIIGGTTIGFGDINSGTGASQINFYISGSPVIGATTGYIALVPTTVYVGGLICIQESGGSFVLGGGATADLVLTAAASHHLIFDINSVEKARIANGFMIGTTTDPGSGYLAFPAGSGTGGLSAIKGGVAYPVAGMDSSGNVAFGDTVGAGGTVLTFYVDGIAVAGFGTTYVNLPPSMLMSSISVLTYSGGALEVGGSITADLILNCAASSHVILKQAGTEVARFGLGGAVGTTTDPGAGNLAVLANSGITGFTFITKSATVAGFGSMDGSGNIIVGDWAATSSGTQIAFYINGSSEAVLTSTYLSAPAQLRLSGARAAVNDDGTTLTIGGGNATGSTIINGHLGSSIGLLIQFGGTTYAQITGSTPILQMSDGAGDNTGWAPSSVKTPPITTGTTAMSVGTTNYPTNPAGGNVILTLPTLASVPEGWIAFCSDTTGNAGGGGTVYWSPQGSDKIRGSSSNVACISTAWGSSGIQKQNGQWTYWKQT